MARAFMTCLPGFTSALSKATSRQQIRKDKTFPFNGFTHRNDNGNLEHGAVKSKAVKFAIFAARVNVFRNFI